MTAAALAIVVIAIVGLAWVAADARATRRERAKSANTISFLAMELDNRDRAIRNLNARWHG